MIFDEMTGHGGVEEVRDSYRALAQWLADSPPDLLEARSRQAEFFFRRMGVTFAVYGEANASERLIPFDIVPRILSASEWRLLEAASSSMASPFWTGPCARTPRSWRRSSWA